MVDLKSRRCRLLKRGNIVHQAFIFVHLYDVYLISTRDVKTSPGEHCTHKHKRTVVVARPEREARVLLFHCCCCIAAVPLLSKCYVPWLRRCFCFSEKVWFYNVLPQQLRCSLGYVFVPISYMFRTAGIITHTHAQKHRPWPSQREEL